uniref:Ig-like domain-containing protein n=1 Tax=Oryzias latipes TaxID=8090 RepID=A0A3P9J233_ORYLA
MKILVLLLVLLTVSECEKNVTGRTGQNITLTCKYDIKTNGPTYVCWGRGPLPSSGCSNQLLATDGHKVINESRASSRYQLQGRVDEGDVSLTIMNVTEEDAGLYGCRVEIFGPFNDEKHPVHLTVNRAPRLISTPSSGTTSSSSDIHQTTAATLTSVPCPAGHMTSTDNNQTASALEDSDKGVTLVVLASVVFMLLVLVTAGILIIMGKCCSRSVWVCCVCFCVFTVCGFVFLQTEDGRSRNCEFVRRDSCLLLHLGISTDSGLLRNLACTPLTHFKPQHQSVSCSTAHFSKTETLQTPLSKQTLCESIQAA